MSYAPSTRLSYNNGRDTATVLTDGMVMTTMADGVPWRQYMKLIDWLFLSAPEVIPIVEATPEKAVRQDIPSYTKAHERTKFKWVLDKNNYRVAVQTKKGVLQVKSVIDGGGEVHTNCNCVPCWEYYNNAPWRRLPLIKKNFNNYSDWVNSLPEGGKISIEEP
jgi:hypothetical protein